MLHDENISKRIQHKGRAYLQKITKQSNTIPLVVRKSKVTYLAALLSIGFAHAKLVDKVVKKLEGKYVSYI